MANTFTVSFKNDDIPYSITIECLDRPVIVRWYESIKQVYQKPPKISMNYHPNHQHPTIIEKNKKWVQDVYEELLAAIANLKLIGVEWPCKEPAQFNYDQQWCNRIHRYFTTMTQYKKLSLNGPQVIADPGPHIKDFYNYAHIINDCVHKLESYCTTAPRKKYFCSCKSLLINVPDLDYDIYKVHKFNYFTAQDYQYHSWDHDCDVIFEDEILGKSIFCSFYDEDNPDYFDTTGHHGWYGSFKILADRNRQKIYHSDDFNNWLTSHGVSKNSPNIRGEFPIGKIIHTSIPDFRTIERAKNITEPNIIFHN